MHTTFLLRLFALVLLPTVVWGQSLNISTKPNTAGNNPSTFSLENGKISINSNEVQFLDANLSVTDFEAYGISPDNSLVSFLKRTPEGGEITIFSSSGDTLNQYETISLASNDPSQAVYPFNTGNTLLRNNITNFTFYDTFGDINTNMSSSSQSQEGEAISEVTMDDDGETLVIYNPKIKRSGNLGSRAQVKMPEEQFSHIFSSRERFIQEVMVSEGGGIVSILTSRQGSNDQVIIMDKFGNELNRIETDEDLQGISFSDNSEYITLYSQGRVMVYPSLGGDRIGSTSIRNPVFQAKYFPEDDLILILNGSYSESSGILNNVEVRAVDIEQRQIASKAYGRAIGFTQALKTDFIRSSAGSYELKGGSQELVISANF